MGRVCTGIDMDDAADIPTGGVVQIIVQQIGSGDRLYRPVRAVIGEGRRQPGISKQIEIPQMNMRIDEWGPGHAILSGKAPSGVPDGA
jgi:hypothetical protein